MTPEAIVEGITAARKIRGSKLAILGHHYQREEVIRWGRFSRR
jgi:quinolinate synthase